MKNILAYLTVAVLSLSAVASVKGFASEQEPIEKPIPQPPVETLGCPCKGCK